MPILPARGPLPSRSEDNEVIPRCQLLQRVEGGIPQPGPRGHPFRNTRPQPAVSVPSAIDIDRWANASFTSAAAPCPPSPRTCPTTGKLKAARTLIQMPVSVPRPIGHPRNFRLNCEFQERCATKSLTLSKMIPRTPDTLLSKSPVNQSHIRAPRTEHTLMRTTLTHASDATVEFQFARTDDEVNTRKTVQDLRKATFSNCLHRMHLCNLLVEHGVSQPTAIGDLQIP